jgi:DNA-binding transcriptional regulator YiaG
MKDRAGYEAMSLYLSKQFELRGLNDARAKLALIACSEWDRLEVEWPPVTTLKPEASVDELEVALQLREGERGEAHEIFAQRWVGWRDVDLRSQVGVDLTAEPTPIGKLDHTPLTSREVCRLRAHTGLTPEDFGALLGVSRQRVYVWESEGTSTARSTASALLRLYWTTYKRLGKG